MVRRYNNKVLVTGASGFTGRYVWDCLLEHGYEPYALTKDGSVDGQSISLCDADDVKAAVRLIMPDSVIHLAGVAYVDHGTASDFYKVNVAGTINLLQALLEAKCMFKDAVVSDEQNFPVCVKKSTNGVIVLASSANIYGNAYQDHAISEENAPCPVNDYAMSKLCMEQVARLWSDMYELPIVITRPFNYTGVGQSENFLIPKIVKAFKDGKAELELGNIEVWRDFSDVRDVARYYVSLIEDKIPQTAVNLCSGNVASIREVISLCQNITGHNINIRSVKQFQRANELIYLQGSKAKLKSLINEKADARYSLKDTLQWMLSK